MDAQDGDELANVGVLQHLSVLVWLVFKVLRLEARADLLEEEDVVLEESQEGPPVEGAVNTVQVERVVPQIDLLFAEARHSDQLV